MKIWVQLSCNKRILVKKGLFKKTILFYAREVSFKKTRDIINNIGKKGMNNYYDRTEGYHPSYREVLGRETLTFGCQVFTLEDIGIIASIVIK